MEILAVFNAKGGVAKTTSTVNLGTCFAAMGARVLIVDLDYQGNATTSLGTSELPSVGSYDLITGSVGVAEVCRPTFIPDLSMIGATRSLAAVDVELALKESQHDVLRRLLAPSAGDFDVVLLDCPPAMGVMTLNALASCSAVLIPSPPEPYAHDGLLRTWSLITRIRGELNTGMTVLGILPTLVTAERTEAQEDVLTLMRAEFGSRIPRQGIPRDDALFSRAAAHSVPACVMAPEAEASCAYVRIACQLLDASPGKIRLRRLDDEVPASDAQFSRCLDQLRMVQASVQDTLLAKAINATVVDPGAEVLPLPPDLGLPPTRVPFVLAVAGMTLLGGVIGYVAGWLSATGLL